MKSEKQFRLVYVEWEDSHGCSSSWEFIDQCQPSVTICRSVGWLIHEDKTCKILVPHLLPSNGNNIRAQGCGDMTIPASAVRKIQDIKIGLESVKR